jgi:hypothetical protein
MKLIAADALRQHSLPATQMSALAGNTIMYLWYTSYFNSIDGALSAGLRNLYVMLRRVEAGPDSADHLAIDDN